MSAKPNDSTSAKAKIAEAAAILSSLDFPLGKDDFRLGDLARRPAIQYTGIPVQIPFARLVNLLEQVEHSEGG